MEFRKNWSSKRRLATLNFLSIRSFIFLSFCFKSSFSQPSPFNASATWIVGCLGQPSNCISPTATLTEYVAALSSSKVPALTSSQIEASCVDPCIENLLTSLQTSLEQPSIPGSPTCSVFSNSTKFAAFLSASKAFSCMSSDSGSTSCVDSVSNLLTNSKILPTPRSLMQPSLRFSNSNLSSICSALVPAAGCCMRTWAMLMSALANQLCFNDLAQEYLALPGRCEALLQTKVAQTCINTWPFTLAPLLSPQDRVCTAEVQQLSLSWLDGSACTARGTPGTSCFGDACDIWCSYFADYTTFLNGPSPSPPQPPAPLFPPEDDEPFNSQVKAFIIAFSVIVFVILAAFVCWLLWSCCVKQRKKWSPQLEDPEDPGTPRYEQEMQEIVVPSDGVITSVHGVGSSSSRRAAGPDLGQVGASGEGMVAAGGQRLHSIHGVESDVSKADLSSTGAIYSSTFNAFNEERRAAGADDGAGAAGDKAGMEGDRAGAVDDGVGAADGLPDTGPTYSSTFTASNEGRIIAGVDDGAVAAYNGVIAAGEEAGAAGDGAGAAADGAGAAGIMTGALIAGAIIAGDGVVGAKPIKSGNENVAEKGIVGEDDSGGGIGADTNAAGVGSSTTTGTSFSRSGAQQTADDGMTIDANKAGAISSTEGAADDNRYSEYDSSAGGGGAAAAAAAIAGASAASGSAADNASPHGEVSDSTQIQTQTPQLSPTSTATASWASELPYSSRFSRIASGRDSTPNSKLDRRAGSTRIPTTTWQLAPDASSPMSPGMASSSASPSNLRPPLPRAETTPRESASNASISRIGNWQRITTESPSSPGNKFGIAPPSNRGPSWVGGSVGSGGSDISSLSGKRPPWRPPSAHPLEASPQFLGVSQPDSAASTRSTSPQSLGRPQWRPPSGRPHDLSQTPSALGSSPHTPPISLASMDSYYSRRTARISAGHSSGAHAEVQHNEVEEEEEEEKSSPPLPKNTP